MTVTVTATVTGFVAAGALLTGTFFGYDKETEKWANLEGANWEDALFSNSDIKNICTNPTLLEDDRLLLGCR
eukprot:779711-Prorocentrum_minimum.AAC.3